jgi:tetratricopeptide (TPR) repeat protein
MTDAVPLDLSPGAGALLRLLAFVAHEPFPLPALSASADELPPPLGAAAADPAALEAMEVELQAAGLLEAGGPAPVLRADVADAVRHGLGAEGGAWAAAAAGAVASAYPRDPERADLATQADVLLPHALRAAAFCDAYDQGMRAAGHCLLSAGRTLLARGRPGPARDALEASVRMLETGRGAGHPAVAMALTYLNGALSALGDRAGMLDNARRALAILEAAHGPRHPEVVVHVNNVGTLLRGAGELEASIPYFLRAMELSEEVFGPAHPLTATLHGNLGDVLHRLRRLDEARPHLARALAADEAAYGPAHPSVARDLHRLGRLLAELGEQDEAAVLLQRAIDYLQPAAGEADPRVQHLRADIRALGSG